MVKDGVEKDKGYAPKIFKDLLHTSCFNIGIILLIIVDAIIASGILNQTKFFYRAKNRYFAQVIFTLIFDLEALFKFWCVGVSGYFRRSIFRFEFALAIGNTLHVLPFFYHTQLFTVFQVLRIVRLIKASPMLENFVYKIFGPGKKLGSLILFTVCLLIIASSISLQLFCFMDLKQFSTFPYAFMSMFQILTQEGWVELMDDIMWNIGVTFAPFVAIYLTFYHLFVTLIVLSLFVAVILDNLELEEDIKKLKQLKLSEQTADKESRLPWRLRIYNYFSPRPKLIKLNKQYPDFALPKLRESFVRQFMADDSPINVLLKSARDVFSSQTMKPPDTMKNSSRRHQLERGTGAVAGKRKEAKLLGEDISELIDLNQSTPSPVDDEGGIPYKLIDKPANKRQQLELKKRPFYQTGPDQVSLQNRYIVEAYIKHNEDLREAISKYLTPNKDSRIESSDQSLLNHQSFHKGKSRYQKMGPRDKLFQRKNTGMYKPKVRTTDDYESKIGTKQTRFDDLTGPTKTTAAYEGATTGTGDERKFDIKAFQHKKQQAELRRNAREDELRENHPFFDSPLFIIGRDSAFRKKFLYRLVNARFDYTPRDVFPKWNPKYLKTGLLDKVFNLLGMVTYLDWIMILTTSLSCVFLMMETSDKRIMITPLLKISDYVFLFAMTIELSLKIMCNGLIFTPNAYLKDFGGFLDLFIYIINVYFIFWMPMIVPQASAAQILMVFRAFRPLRIFVLVPHIRKVIKELCRSVKEIALVSILMIASLFIFASYGVQLYAGKLARCNDPTIKERRLCKGIFLREIFVTKLRFPDKSQNVHPKIWVPRVWANPRNYNFDNVQNAMLALFEILSFKGWTDIRDMLISQVGPLHAIYVHIFVFVACMIGLTLFVGVVIANYMENKGTALLTVDQRRWCDLKARLKIAQPLFLPKKPSTRFQSALYDLTQKSAFKKASVYLIILQTSLLSVKWKKDTKYSYYLALTSSVFIFIFVIECAIKIKAFTFHAYWQSKRNRYDFIITLISVLWVILFFPINTDTFYYMGYFVIILRFFSLVGKHPILQMLMLTVVMSFFKSFFIITAMFLLIITYSLIGVILFGNVKFGENLGRQANFQTAPRAMIVLFRIVTGEDWNKILHDTMIQPPYCTPGDVYWDTDCGNPTAALIYFCSFYIIITYIVLNLLVAIIMENFSLFYSNEEDALISHTDIRNFQMIWNIVDTNQKGYIPKWKVKFLLRLLKGRLQVDLEKEKTLFQHMCYEIEKMNPHDEVSFHDVLNVLAYRSVDIQKSLQIEELLEREELEYIIREEVAKQTIRKWLEKCLLKKRKDKSDLLRPNQDTTFLESLHKVDGGGNEMEKITEQVLNYYLSNKNMIFLEDDPPNEIWDPRSTNKANFNIVLTKKCRNVVSEEMEKYKHLPFGRYRAFLKLCQMEPRASMEKIASKNFLDYIYNTTL